MELLGPSYYEVIVTLVDKYVCKKKYDQACAMMSLREQARATIV